jgi:ABC-type cobalamin/Fe3+-siderophores transport system ATPase subunit
LKLTIDTLVSSAGDTVRLAPAGVTCLVGGNNAGKSQLLRDIEFMISEPDSEPVTLTAVTGSKPHGSIDEVRGWLEQGAGIPIEQTIGQAQRWVPTNGKISGESAGDFSTWFESFGPELYLGNAAPFFIHRAEAGALKEYASGLAYDGQAFNGGLAKLLADGDLEQELSDVVESVFGTPVTLDRVNPQAQLRVGKTTVDVPPINRPTKAYSDAVSNLKPLDAQGDGMRAFVGFVLLVLTGAPSVLLIDEPEAFLHPGQARALGRWLAEQATKRNLQVVLATHDRDVVLGLLDAEGDRSTNIVRIVRSGQQNVLTQLSPRQIEEVWNDPVLRYSNLLQGLFHQRVVICESDADCRFYSAALDDLGAVTNRKSEAGEVLFVPSGSKSRVASMVSALTKLGVQAMAIVDFDVLRNKADICAIVESVGAVWEGLLKEKYMEMIRSDDQKALWGQLKNQGINGLANGPSYSAGRELLAQLRSLGIHVVPVGEMEQFDRGIRGHGGEWVSAALEQRTYSNEGVREFVGALVTRSPERLIA